MRAGSPALLAVIALWWLAVALTAPVGLFNVDELIYAAAIHAMAAGPGVTIANGYSELGSDALRLWLMVEGPDGLVPQYPSGYALLAAPFYALMGLRGVLLLNALAAIGALVLTYRLSRRLYDDPRVATMAVVLLGLASFMPDYALAIWPHALSVLAVLAAVSFAIEAVEREGTDAQLHAALTGLVIGAGINLRVDTVLLLPAIGLWGLIFAAKPLRLVLPGVLGLVPGLALASLLNWQKFEVLSPISYGKSGQGTQVDPSGHPVLAMVVLVLLILATLLRLPQVRRSLRQPVMIGAGIALAGLAVGLVPELRAGFLRYATGAYALLMDIRGIEDPRPGVILREDGTLSFWGFWKKALGQSLPWLGILALLATRWRHLAGRVSGRHLVLFLLIGVVWLLPFARTAWHGGLGSNMRYLLPLVPMLAVLAAACWVDLVDRAKEQELPLGRWAGLGLLAGGVVLIAVAAPRSPGDALAALQQIVPQWALAALAAATLATGLSHPRGRRIATAAAVAVAAPAMVLAILHGSILDPLANIVRRASFPATLLPDAATARPSLVYAAVAEAHFGQLVSPTGALANPGRVDEEVDVDLVRTALAQGYDVYVDSRVVAEALVATDPELTFRARSEAETRARGGPPLLVVERPSSRE